VVRNGAFNVRVWDFGLLDREQICWNRLGTSLGIVRNSGRINCLYISGNTLTRRNGISSKGWMARDDRGGLAGGSRWFTEWVCLVPII
jgi:hypothetical protein